MKNSKTIIENYLKKEDWRVKESSSAIYCFGSLQKYMIGEMSKDYWLRYVYPDYISKKYINGDLHIHDLSGLTLYCCGYSLKNIILMGLQGIENVSNSSPAKHFASILSQVANLVTIYQNEIMGAVAFNGFDTLLAPFIKKDNLSYKEVKQSMQNFIHAINSNSRAGAEPAFTNITFDLTPPKYMLEENPFIGEEFMNFTYKDCQKEIDMLNKAFWELMIDGDSKGKPFAYPIPTYNIHKRFDWDNPNNELLWEMAGKYGYPYFANFINSDMEVEDVRSMALLSNQKIIYKKANGDVSINEIRKIAENWLKENSENKPKYKILMNGNFVDCTEMFKIDYSKYGTYNKITLENGYEQNFSYDHKCAVLGKDGIEIKLSQDIKNDDKFLLSKNAWGINNNIGNYNSGKILGYYLAEGWKTHNNELNFAININRKEIVDEIENYFLKNGCKVKHKKMVDVNIYKVFVYGSSAKGFVEQFIDGDTAKTKRLKCTLWNTSDSFRQGIYDGYYETDGCKSHNIFAHTVNKKLCDDLIIMASSIGKILKYRKNEKNTRYFKDKNDKNIFTSYELKVMDYDTYEDYYIVKVRENKSVLANDINYVYNFTVNTKKHLFELPNGIISHQCCRLRLDLSELKRRNGGLFGSGDSTGSIGVVTINMPRLGHLYKNNIKGFYNELDELLCIAKDSLEIKRKWLKENILDKGLIPAFSTYVGTLDNHFSTIGIIGYNEMCENLFGKDILDNKSKEFCIEVSNHIRNKLVEFQEETGHLYNFEATPAEGLSYRFAKIDSEKYENIITQGDKQNPYYTNSCHIPVDKIKDIDSTFKHQESLQELFTGGTVIHCYLDGSINKNQAKQIVKSMCENYKVPYISLSPINRYCEEHGFIVDCVDKCPICGKELEKYQRVTGYIRNVKNFNIGKKQEFNDRNQLKI